MKIKELKSKLKVLASLIRKSKHSYKECQRSNMKWDDYFKWQRENNHPNSDTYRHMHIAYCLLRGRTYEQIENKVKEGNGPSIDRVEYYMQEYSEVEPIECA